MNNEIIIQNDIATWKYPNEELSPSSTYCPKCSLEFKYCLHQFCQHNICPVRDFKDKCNGKNI